MRAQFAHRLAKSLFSLQRHPRWSRFVLPWVRCRVADVEPDEVWRLPSEEASPMSGVEVWGYRDSIVDVNSGILIRKSRAVKSSFRMLETHREQLEIRRMAPAIQPAMRCEGAVVSLDWAWSTNYFHFMRETLTMVYALRALPSDVPLTLLTHHGLPPGAEALVTAIVHQAEVLSVPHLSRVRASVCLAVCVSNNALGLVNPVEAGFDFMPSVLRSLLQEKWRGLPLANLPRRIFLGRGDAKHRRLLNEPAIVEMLALRGFQPMFLTGRTVGEQFELFRNAEAIVAVRGATIANLVAISHPLKFISIRPTDETETIVQSMVERGELIYGEVCGDGRDKNDDFSIDLADLAAELDRLGIH